MGYDTEPEEGQGFYGEETQEELLDEDEISPAEYGFIYGYRINGEGEI